MKWLLINLDELDFADMGSWPNSAKVLIVVVCLIIVTYLGYLMMVKDTVQSWKAAENVEQALKQTYSQKFAVAANLTLYQEQLIEIQVIFEKLLQYLPATDETPELLDNITQIGRQSGLIFVGIRWLSVIDQSFYLELPIAIEVIGNFHQFGEFVSQLSQLPIVVTLHDFTISRSDHGDLHLYIVAKTYRYQTKTEK